MWTDNNRYLLADVLVLIKPFLGNVRLAQLHTQLQILLHNWLVNLLPCSVLLAFDDIVKGIQGTLSFADINKLCKSSGRVVRKVCEEYTHISKLYETGAAQAQTCRKDSNLGQHGLF